MRIVFMGTPEIAADVLRAVSKKHEVVGVFCQPDKPVGRKQILTPPPVKVAALEAGLPVFQPKGFRNGKATQLLREIDPDLILVIAYGRILPQEVLDIPKYGCVNIHASLLPKYRGSAPVQRALIDGVKVTGITVMKMDAGVDTGDVFARKEMPVSPSDDAQSMFERMGKEAGPFVLDVIEKIGSGEAVLFPQSDEDATYAPPIEKSEGLFSFRGDAEKIVNLVHGLSMWPVAFFLYEGKKIKVENASLSNQTGVPGEILSAKPMTVAAENGSVILARVIPEGGKPMDGTAWMNGKRLRVGDVIKDGE